MFSITYVDVVLFFTDQDWHKNVKMHIFSLNLVLLFDGKTQFSYVFLLCFVFLKKCKTLILKIQTFFPWFSPQLSELNHLFLNLNLNVQHECSISAKCYSSPDIINNLGLFTNSRVQ